MHLADKAEIIAVFEGRQHGAPVLAAIGQQHGGGEVLWIAVYGIAEEHELNNRDADNHAERKTISPHLDKFLDDDGPEARKRQ